MATTYAKLKLLIIDECSMVGQVVFTMIDKRLRQIFNNDRPFGGISVILVGDLFQLKPVFSTPLYYPLTADPYEEIFGNNFWHNLSVSRLTKIMRQSSVSLQTALNNLAVGEMTDANIQLLQSRQYCSWTIPFLAKRGYLATLSVQEIRSFQCHFEQIVFWPANKMCITCHENVPLTC